MVNDPRTTAPALSGAQVLALAARSKAGPPIYSHTSATPVTDVLPCEQDGRISAMGFWYAVHFAWLIEATARGDFGAVAGRFVHIVDLGQSRIMRIQTREELSSFERQYATVQRKTEIFRTRLEWRLRRGAVVLGRHVDWRAVAADWDGIEISPWRYDDIARTAAHAWLGNWDIDSGCVWRPRGVRVTVLGRVPGEVTPWAAPNP